MRRKRYYDAVRDRIRDVQDEPARQRPRLTVASLLAPPVQCAACWERIEDRAAVPFSCDACMGAYCRSCLEGYGRAALSDRSILPLRCANSNCRSPVPLSTVTPLLSAEEGAQLARFQQERTSPVKVSQAAATAAASAAAEEEEKEKVLGLMNDLGWRRCPDCGMGIERTQGCAHMVCVCGSEFCYSCGTRWDEGSYGCPRRCRIFGAEVLHDVEQRNIEERFGMMREHVLLRIWATINELQALLRDQEGNRVPVINRGVATRFAPEPRTPFAQRFAPGNLVTPFLGIATGERGNNRPTTETVESQTAQAEPPPASQRVGKMSVFALIHPNHHHL